MKSIKKTLIACALSTALCVTALVGTTFAWFTDSITNKGNKIQAGTLDIAATVAELDATASTYTVEGLNGGKAFGFSEAQNIEESETPIISEENWEPGRTNAKLLTVTNNGSLATQIKLTFDAQDGGLADALWYDFIGVNEGAVSGAFTERPMSTLKDMENREFPLYEQNDSVQFILVYGMNEEAGNEYQNKSFTADVTILAKQIPYETDGFGNSDYDRNATYPVANAAELTEAVGKIEDGDTIALTGDISLAGELTIDKSVTIDGMGNALISSRPLRFTGEETTVRNAAFIAPNNDSKNATTLYFTNSNVKEIILENCTFSDPQWEVVQITSTNLEKLVINNCTFTAANVDGVANGSYGNAADEAIRYIHIEPSANTVMDITITNNTFKNCNKVKDSVVGLYFIDGSNVTVGGNTFENLVEDSSTTSNKLSVGWPEDNRFKNVSLWTGEIQSLIVNDSIV